MEHLPQVKVSRPHTEVYRGNSRVLCVLAMCVGMCFILAAIVTSLLIQPSQVEQVVEDNIQDDFHVVAESNPPPAVEKQVEPARPVPQNKEEPAKKTTEEVNRDEMTEYLWHRHGRNFIAIDDEIYRVDSRLFGTAVFVYVIQVLDKENFLGETIRSGKRETMWFHGFDTSKMVDFADTNFGGQFYCIVGTKSYIDVRHSRRTVHLAVNKNLIYRGVTLDQFRDILAKGLPLGKDWTVREPMVPAKKNNIAKAIEEAKQKELEIAAEKKRLYNSPEQVAKRREEDAARKLGIAKSQLASGRELVSAGKEDEGTKTMQFAVNRLTAIVREFPGTAAAAEATKVLDELRRR